MNSFTDHGKLSLYPDDFFFINVRVVSGRKLTQLAHFAESEVFFSNGEWQNPITQTDQVQSPKAIRLPV